MFEAFLSEVLDEMVSRKNVYHAVLSVESLSGDFTWSGAKGVADRHGREMTVDTPFWIASITKLFISASILKLYEQKRLMLDDLVSHHLSESLLKKTHIYKGVDYSDQLTIKHLLTHATGYPDYLEIKGNKRKTLIDEVIEGEDKEWSIEDVMTIVRRHGKPFFKPQNLNNHPYKVRYSDTNFQLLIAIIEKITEDHISTVFNEFFYEPLGMNQTYHPGMMPRYQAPKEATVWLGKVAFDDKPRGLASFGDLNSTLKDLTIFMRGLLNGEVFDHKKTLDLMLSQWQTFGLGISLLAPGWPIQYGKGVMRVCLPRFLTPFKPVPEHFGHTGATGSWLFYCPEYGLIVVGNVSQVTAAPVPFKMMPKILRAYKEKHAK